MKPLRTSGAIVARRRTMVSSTPSVSSMRRPISNCPSSITTRLRKNRPIAWMSGGPHAASALAGPSCSSSSEASATHSA